MVLLNGIIKTAEKDDEYGGRSERELYIQETVEDDLGWLVIGFEYEMDDTTFRFIDSPHHCVLLNKIWEKRCKTENMKSSHKQIIIGPTSSFFDGFLYLPSCCPHQKLPDRLACKSKVNERRLNRDYE